MFRFRIGVRAFSTGKVVPSAEAVSRLRSVAQRIALAVHRASTGGFAHPSTRVFRVVQALKRAGLKDGQTLTVGGFGLCGIPMACIRGRRCLLFAVRDLAHPHTLPDGV